MQQSEDALLEGRQEKGNWRDSVDRNEEIEEEEKEEGGCYPWVDASTAAVMLDLSRRLSFGLRVCE